MANIGFWIGNFMSRILVMKIRENMDEEVRMLFQCMLQQQIYIICLILMNGRIVANN
jgi:hypothetical protein